MLWEKKQRPATPKVRAPLPVLAPPQISDLGEPMTDSTRKELVPATTHQNGTFLGRSVVFQGEVSGNEDMVIEGQLEGVLNLQECCVTVGPNGRVKADIHARLVVTQGSVTGNISAREKIEIRRTGHVVGDLAAAAIAIEEGAYFKGSIEILREESRVPSGTHPPGEVSGGGT